MTLHRGKDSVVSNITILVDVTPALFQNARAIGVGVGIFIFCLLMIAVFVWNRIYVIVHYKRVFGRPVQGMLRITNFLKFISHTIVITFNSPSEIYFSYFLLQRCKIILQQNLKSCVIMHGFYSYEIQQRKPMLFHIYHFRL